MNQIKVLNSIYASFIETIVTYPIDYIKTNNQVSKKIIFTFNNQSRICSV